MEFAQSQSLCGFAGEDVRRGGTFGASALAPLGPFYRECPRAISPDITFLRCFSQGSGLNRGKKPRACIGFAGGSNAVYDGSIESPGRHIQRNRYERTARAAGPV
jgi:hypothetical protein